MNTEEVLSRAALVFSTAFIVATFVVRRRDWFNAAFLALCLVPLMWIELWLMWTRRTWMPDEMTVGHHVLRNISYYAVARLFDAYNVRWQLLAPGTAVFLVATTPGLVMLGATFACADKRLIKRA